MTNLGEAAPDFTSSVTTNAVLKDMNIGSICIILDGGDVGDMALTPGDLIYCTSRVVGTSTTWQAIRSGIPAGESITYTDLAVEAIEWSRTGGD
jgi:hypothetical protein